MDSVGGKEGGSRGRGGQVHCTTSPPFFYGRLQESIGTDGETYLSKGGDDHVFGVPARQKEKRPKKVQRVREKRVALSISGSSALVFRNEAASGRWMFTKT